MALVEKNHGELVGWAGERRRPAVKSMGARAALLLPFAIAAILVYAAVAHGFWLGAVWTLATLVAWIFLRGAAEASADAAQERRARRGW